jgi:hypothetical protein
MIRQRNEPLAVDAAWRLLQEAKDKLEEVRLEAKIKSPEAQAEWEKERAEYLAAIRISYQVGVKCITGVNRWSGQYGALNWFKKFLRWKAEKQEKTQDAVEARVEAWLIKYRGAFPGTEAKKLQNEYNVWRNKGKQGRVKRRRDERLRENKEKRRARQLQEKAQQAGKAWGELSRPKLTWERMDAAQAKAAIGRKTPIRGSATTIKETDSPIDPDDTF